MSGRAEQVALVTGGARRIGAAIVERLIGDGWRVVIHYHRSGEAARGLAARFDARAVAVTQDLAVSGGAEALLLVARRTFGAPVRALVNNASLFDYDAPPQVGAESLAAHHAINLAAPVLLANALARQDELDRGAIVNLLDQKIANPNPDFFAYSTTKFALAGATAMLAQALGPRIAVNAVAPGLTLPSADQSEAEYRTVAADNLLKRPVSATAVADAVAFLLRARGLHGQTLYVDGGQRFIARHRDVMFATRGAGG